LEFRNSSSIGTNSKIPDPTISSKMGPVSSSMIISDSPKETLNIHFSLLFQTVLKINFKIFLLDPVI
jgi:hypothetical protein